MRRLTRTLFRSNDGAVAPTVALSLTALIAAGGIAFDYSRMATMHTELQQAADQAALAAATQLDRQTDSITRAQAAAQNLISNTTLLANDGGPRAIGGLTFTFYDGYNQANDTFGNVTTLGAAANVVKVTVGGRTARFALTPIVGALNSGPISAQAVAGIGHAICKVPPVMVCNPAEPANNTNELLPFAPTAGVGLKLVTGDATVPGNFGWLQSTAGNGASTLAEELGYNSPPGSCQPTDNVTTKTGMDSSVLDAFNTRFDIYANGNQSCPSQDGGTCSPSDVTRKDLVCSGSGANPSACRSTPNWAEASKPYRLVGGAIADLPTTGASDPTIMGYPPDECHMTTTGVGACGVTGNGVWDRNAYFRVNYGWNAGTWPTQTGLSAQASRYDVYKWERAHPNPNGKGISVRQRDGTTTKYGFGWPATGHPGAPPAGSQADRRVMALAVLNCRALTLHGKSSGVPVATWMDVFLVQPVISRSGTPFTASNVYVEEIGTTNPSGADANPTVIRRDEPYLIR